MENLPEKAINTSITTTDQPNEMFFDIQAFELGQRVATMLSNSTMVPQHFQGNIGNCMIALNLSARVGLDPFMVMQKMYVIQGKPGLEAQLMIALINKTGIFSPLEYVLSGEGATRQCYAKATRLSTGEEVNGSVVSMEIAKREGWLGKKGSKWQTMPDLMLTYRSAAFFGRIHCPEALMGMMTTDELHDIRSTPPGQMQIKIKPKQVVQRLNPLHATPEWKEWTETCDLFPDITGKMQTPVDIAQCVTATQIVKQQVDAESAA